MRATPRAAPAWLRGALALPRDKADTLLLLFACALVLAPHALHLPPWIAAGAGATLLWRTALTLRGQRMPPRWLLLPLALLAMGGVYLSFHTVLGREAGVAMLSMLLAFKLLEMHAKRDLFIVIFLGHFLLLTSFFYSQSMAMALLAGCTMLILLTAQLSFQYAAVVPPLARRLRLAATLLAGAAPLVALLFVGFPRVQGPLWGLPDAAAGTGGGGLSETMAPGSIAGLALSEETAFRAHFAGPAPAQGRLYWRAIVLADYDGRVWHRAGAARAGASDLSLNGAPLPYQVTLEAGAGRWLPTLDMLEWPGRLDGAYALTPERELTARDPAAGRTRYSLSSVLDYRWQARQPPPRLRQWLDLPAGFNPRTLAWAAALQPEAAPATRIHALLKWLRDNHFRYTLRPGVLGRDAVDEFLFTTKAGFCEHYAGAFVVVMRAMGIPARVVTGYQGGEINPLDGDLTVRYSDAHAWAEVWLADSGWLRIDPTAVIAPERIEHNLARALPPRTRFGLPVLDQLIAWQGESGSWLSTLRFAGNALNNAWNQWVLDYNPERQRGALRALDAALGNWPTLAAAAAIGALALGALLLRARRRQDPLDALYQAFCRHQERRGCARAVDEGPQRYGERLAALAMAPQKQAAIARFLAIYGTIKYGVVLPDQKAAALKTLRSLLTQCR